MKEPTLEADTEEAKRQEGEKEKLHKIIAKMEERKKAEGLTHSEKIILEAFEKQLEELLKK